MRGWHTPFDPLPTPTELLVRLVLASALVLGLANGFASFILKAAVPGVRAAFEIVDDDFVVLKMEQAENNGHHVIRLWADLARPAYVNGYRISPMGNHPGERGWYEVLITSGGALQGAVISLIALLAWPAGSPSRLLIRTLVAIPLIATITLFDTAITLLANLWMPLVQDWNPSGWWPSLIWARLLDGGGRFALAFVLAACLVAALRNRAVPAPEPVA